MVIDRAQRRAVLAYLLLNAGVPVLGDQLVDALWGDSPPATAVAQVQMAVSAIRRALRAGGANPIASGGGGYVAQVGEQDLDLLHFEWHVRQARHAESAAAALPELRRAVGLWQGVPLSGINAGFVDAHRARLQERHITAWQQLADVELTLGNPQGLIGDLVRLVADNPLNERLAGYLMLALYRTQRTAEALHEFRELRRRLRAKLGLEPNPEIQLLHRRILANDAALLTDGWPVVGRSRAPERPSTLTAAAATGRSRPVAYERPAQLPAAVSGFVGRGEAIAELDRHAATTDDTAGRRGSVGPRIIVVTGAAGVGKTALVLHWARRRAAGFPDGQLYVNLHGYDVTPPIRPEAALDGFLRALGVSPDRIPLDLDQAAAACRSALADRRVLLVLDNAADVRQVRSLLPGSPGSVVVITSRDRLTGLVAVDGAQVLHLPVLTDSEGSLLVDAILGGTGGGSRPHDVAALVAACGRLPLALRIAAATLAGRPDRDIAEHARRIRDGDTFAVLAVAGDDRAAVGVAFAQSYGSLDPVERRAFRYLALIAGPDVSTELAAVAIGADVDTTAHIVDRLVEANLLEVIGPRRYALHDLLRAYALARTSTEDGETDRHRVVERLFTHYLHGVHAAARQLYPHVVRLDEPLPPAVTFPDPAAALRWMDAERATLLAAIPQAAGSATPEYAWLLADSMRGYLWLGRRTREWFEAATTALDAARTAGNTRGQAAAHLSLGLVHFRLSRFESSWHHYNAALAHARTTGWLHGQTAALDGLGSTALLWNRPSAESAQYYRRAFAINARLHRRSAMAGNASNLGTALVDLGQAESAVRVLTNATRLQRERNSPSGLALALCNLSIAYRALGDTDPCPGRGRGGP
ncbi:BTAD domain-containing putative transcriptional regulator [Dactylosporangium sp. NPDC049140]|uniref:AfsR/SARP family transcriptional regulator n=1 Tax=Dactylosporangium sp. NPDC049140 TaxID=3155647 RepID=UPI0033FD0B69